MKDRLPSKYAAATRRIDIVCGKYSADAWGSSVAMTAHVKASWMPAAEERGRVLGRQASEKPRGEETAGRRGTSVPRRRAIYGDLRSVPERMA